MPSALLRSCASIGCPTLVVSGRCAIHARATEQRRGSAAARGYDAGWRAFRIWFRHRLIAAHVVPVCGATLPGGPSMRDSQCRAAGRLNDGRLQLDHDPPLTEGERHDARAVCDIRRVGFLCHTCHSAKTLRERHGS